MSVIRDAITKRLPPPDYNRKYPLKPGERPAPAPRTFKAIPEHGPANDGRAGPPNGFRAKTPFRNTPQERGRIQQGGKTNPAYRGSGADRERKWS